MENGQRPPAFQKVNFWNLTSESCLETWVFWKAAWKTFVLSILCHVKTGLFKRLNCWVFVQTPGLHQLSKEHRQGTGAGRPVLGRKAARAEVVLQRVLVGGAAHPPTYPTCISTHPPTHLVSSTLRPWKKNAFSLCFSSPYLRATPTPATATRRTKSKLYND